MFLVIIFIILGIVLTYIGCKMATEGNPWGILVAFFGWIIGAIIALILYFEYDKKNKEKPENVYIDHSKIYSNNFKEEQKFDKPKKTLNEYYENDSNIKRTLNDYENLIFESDNKVSKLNEIMNPHMQNISNAVLVPNDVVCTSLFIVMNLLLKYDKTLLDGKYGKQFTIKTYFNNAFDNLIIYNYDNFNPSLLIKTFNN